MQWSLVLFVLMGQCSLFTCQPFKYHFIKEEKNWDKAQEFCRKKHTDLVTVYEDTERLRRSTNKQYVDAWTGLSNKPVSDKNEWNWRWSQAGVEYTEDAKKWCSGEPNNDRHDEYCVIMEASSECWRDVPCTSRHRSICYSAKNPSDTFYMIIGYRTWQQAQWFCRQHYTDLVSGTKQLEELPSKLSDTEGPYWIGLFAENWRWSDGSSSLFRPWNQTFPDNQPGINKCAALDKDGRWNIANCNSKKPFFCYSDNVILIKENKTWEEAINYCREKHNDLISITDAEQQRWVQERAKNATSSHVWLALRFTCILEVWFWVTDERVDYKNWAPNVKMDDCNMSGAMEAGGKHKWIKEDDMMKFNFFCSKS